MKKYFSVGETAKIVGMTTETLRHYDRIGLVKPSRKDKWTNYRYYTEQDIVRLNTVHALQQLDIPLKKIKEVLEYYDLNKVIDFLTEAERKADEKISAIEYSKSRIHAAKNHYTSKLLEWQNTDITSVKYFPERVIMLSDTLETPTLDNLWNYLNHFYGMIESEKRNLFEFEDLAGIYTENGKSRLFAICIRYEKINRLKILPAGNYLCANCTEENRILTTERLMKISGEQYHRNPVFIIEQIILSGILHWNYQIQIFLGD